jgi:hypothetical protein
MDTKAHKINHILHTAHFITGEVDLKEIHIYSSQRDSTIIKDFSFGLSYNGAFSWGLLINY